MGYWGCFSKGFKYKKMDANSLTLRENNPLLIHSSVRYLLGGSSQANFEVSAVEISLFRFGPVTSQISRVTDHGITTEALSRSNKLRSNPSPIGVNFK